MKRTRDLIILAALVAGFLLLYFLPLGRYAGTNPAGSAFALAHWYAREHVLLCLVPAFFIAGAISVFVRRASVMRYLGPKAPKPLAYGVASVSGAILAVCSCTVLPLFAGIYRMGAGLGPAATFLYAGPAINVLAVTLTARVLGLQLGAARAVGAVAFSLVIGLGMHLVFRGREAEKAAAAVVPEPESGRPLWQTAVFFAAMVGVLVFANWSPGEGEAGAWAAVFRWKWPLAAGCAAALALALGAWIGVPWWKAGLAAGATAAAALVAPGAPVLAVAVGAAGLAVALATTPGEPREWLEATWGFARQILPLLLAGVLVAGALLGTPEAEGDGLIREDWIAGAVGTNGPGANLLASLAGALMYFATLTEVPIVQGLTQKGMAPGPALALLLAGPALSLPNMLVIRSVMGTRKTLVFVLLVVVMATASGLIYGAVAG